MKIIWHTPEKRDGSDIYPDVAWPEDWPLPRIGERIAIRLSRAFLVRSIEYVINDDDECASYVYIVLHDGWRGK